MRTITSNKMDRVHDNKLYFDEQEVTSIDDMTGEERTEYSYITIPIEGIELTDEYEKAIAKGDEFKAAREFKKRELAKQKNKWLADAKASYPEYQIETYTEPRSMTEEEKLVHDTDENGELIERDENYEYPTVDEIKEYPHIEVVPEVPAIAEELDENGNIVVEAVDAIPEYEIRRPVDYKTINEWLSEIEPPELTLPSEPKGVALLKQRKAESKYQSQADKLVKGYSRFEVESFGIQEQEAKDYKANNDANTPLIDALVATRGIDKDVLVDKILAKAELFKTAIGGLLGAKQKELG